MLIFGISVLLLFAMMFRIEDNKIKYENKKHHHREISFFEYTPEKDTISNDTVKDNSDLIDTYMYLHSSTPIMFPIY